jgi:hypothetical protein
VLLAAGSTPTAARLYVLLSYVKKASTFILGDPIHVNRISRNTRAIKDDAVMWRDWNRLRRFWYRGTIKTGVARHGQNLSDCFQSFSVSHHFSLFSGKTRLSDDDALVLRPRVSAY